MTRCLVVAALVGATLVAGSGWASSTVYSFTMDTRDTPPPAVAVPIQPTAEPEEMWYQPYDDYTYAFPPYAPPMVYLPPLIARPRAPQPRILDWTRDGLVIRPDTRIVRVPRPYPEYDTYGAIPFYQIPDMHFYSYPPYPYPYPYEHHHGDHDRR